MLFKLTGLKYRCKYVYKFILLQVMLIYYRSRLCGQTSGRNIRQSSLYSWCYLSSQALSGEADFAISCFYKWLLVCLCWNYHSL